MSLPIYVVNKAVTEKKSMKTRLSSKFKFILSFSEIFHVKDVFKDKKIYFQV